MPSNDSNKAKDPIAGLIASVEARLARFYGFEPPTSAADHLMPQSELMSHLSHSDENSAQGSVAFTQCEETSDVFLGIAFSPAIVQNVGFKDPSKELSTVNINACCVVIEEVSHFHLLINRALKKQPVSKLELEWQGEIDKLLICAQLLLDQCGDGHMLPLARQIYDLSSICTNEVNASDRYREATRLAAKFWYAEISSAAHDSAPLLDPNVRKKLSRAYTSSWAGKLEALSTSVYQKVS